MLSKESNELLTRIGPGTPKGQALREFWVPALRSARLEAPEAGSSLTPGSYKCDLWCDIVHLEGAEALASFAEDFYAGRPAVTENHFGKGSGIYVATRPEQAVLNDLVGKLIACCSNIEPVTTSKYCNRDA